MKTITITETQYKWAQEAFEKWMRHYVGSGYRTDKVSPTRRGNDRILYFSVEHLGSGNASLRTLLDEEAAAPRSSIRRIACIQAAALRNDTVEEVDPELSDDRLDQIAREMWAVKEAAPDSDYKLPQMRSLREAGLPDSEVTMTPGTLPARQGGTREDHGPIELRSSDSTPSDSPPRRKRGRPRKVRPEEGTGDHAGDH